MPCDAIKFFNKTLPNSTGEQIPVYAISGNHDGAERLLWALLSTSALHLPISFGGVLLEPAIELEDCRAFPQLPFIDPIDARIYYKDDEDKEIQGFVMPWATLSKIWKSLILRKPIFWWRILRFC